jgi:rubrerythrin
MPAFICTACGAQFTPGEAPPAHCPICEDERQYGQLCT